MNPTEQESSSSRTDEQNGAEKTIATPARTWRRVFSQRQTDDQESDEEASYRPKSTLGILSDKQTDEVPGK